MAVETDRDAYLGEDNVRLYVAINALMKAIGKTARGPNCPKCFKEIDTGDRYCRHCGQRLMWEDNADGKDRR